MPYLIDGDNLLGTWPGRKRSDAERRSLAFQLDRFAVCRQRRVLVVFDGMPPPGLHLEPGARFAGSGQTADDVILEFLRKQQDRRGWIVVTSDRSLGDQCRYLQARLERCDQFRKRLCEEPDQEKPDREADVDYWLDQFEDDD